MSPELIFTPEHEARAKLGDAPLRLRVLRPPYPAIGRGVLRVLRVREGDACELIVGYDGYERIG
jgi:hypothetical protein